MDSSQTYPIRRDAVLCSLAELPDGGLRVVLDDLRQTDPPGHWKHHVLVTFKDYPAGQLDPSALSNCRHSAITCWFACWPSTVACLPRKVLPNAMRRLPARSGRRHDRAATLGRPATDLPWNCRTSPTIPIPLPPAA